MTMLFTFGFAEFASRGYYYSTSNEVPLGGIIGFVVDKNDNIYVGSSFYSRIQVYNKNGKFIRNWKVNSHGGTFTINLSSDENIIVNTARGDEKIVFNKNGTIISKNKINNITYEKSKNDWNKFVGLNGNKYQITGFLFQKIIQVIPQEKVIVNQNILRQIFKGPINTSIIYIASGFGIGLILKRK